MKLILPFAALVLSASPSPAQVALESVKGFADLEKVAAHLALQP
jgi:hypothetical protein